MINIYDLLIGVKLVDWRYKSMEQTTRNNAAKFAFFYLLSLVSLIFVSTAVGAIIFQIINKYIPDVLNNYSGSFSSGALKYGISALIIAAPLYYFLASLIHRSLSRGSLEKDSGVRRWLTYLVLLVTAVTMIGWFISIINTFLDGNLTLKFGLEAITAIAIAAIIFGYYLYDIKREDVTSGKDKIIQIFLYGSLIIILASFIFSLFVVESPREARARRIDQETISNFNKIDSDINRYYTEYKKLPDSLEAVKTEYNYLQDSDFKNPTTGKVYDYKVLNDTKYQLCTDFKTSTYNQNDTTSYYDKRWSHEAGYQCLMQKVYVSGVDSGKVAPVAPTPKPIQP